MKTINKIFFVLLSAFLASPVFAANQSTTLGNVDSEPPKIFDGIDTLLDSIVVILFPVAGLACVVFIIIGGYTWIASAGDPAKVQQAQGTLTWAIIGLVFVLIAGLIVNTVTGFIN